MSINLPHRRALLGGAPSWLPRPAPLLYADFAGGHYWFGRPIQDFASWLAAVGGTFSRAGSATFLGSNGLIQTAGTNVPRFAYDASGVARGIRLSGARTNIVLWNRDFTNAAWTKSSVTAVLDQAGIDGSANSASRLTATADNATVLQSKTSGSTARSQGCYVKRLVGTGNIDMTMDGGSTWTTISGSINSSGYSRVSIPVQTLANPQVGFRIVTNGDSIAADGFQTESKPYGASDVIFTTTVAVAQVSDVLLVGPTGGLPFAGFNVAAYTVLSGFQATTGLGQGGIFSLNDNVISNALDLRPGPALHSSFLTRAGSATQLAFSTLTPGTAYKIAAAAQAGDRALSINGAAVLSDAPSAMPISPDRLRIGNIDDGTNPDFAAFTNVSQIAVWSSRLSNADLRRLST